MNHAGGGLLSVVCVGAQQMALELGLAAPHPQLELRARSWK